MKTAENNVDVVNNNDEENIVNENIGIIID
jgi:hypothetical protein